RRLQGKVALITGGASGIGESTAKLFAKHGAKVVIADVQDELGQTLAKTIQSSASYVHCNPTYPAAYVQCDVSKESDVKNAVEGAVSIHGKLDIMYSNAAVSGNPNNFKLTSLENHDLDRVMKVNVYGAFYCASHAARVMMVQKKGTILFTSSGITASYGDAGAAYSASKMAVVGLMKSSAVELGRYGIRVNAVSPGGIATPMAVSAFGGTADDTAEIQKLFRPTGMGEETFKEVMGKIANLKGASLEADDVAEAAVYLGSDEGKYVSGMNLVVDGGYGLKSGG
ncbi:Short chain aldehyde dehydrogenase 1, partial [Linum perenne]